jgi:flagellar basal body L-ring protein FlgH
VVRDEAGCGVDCHGADNTTGRTGPCPEGISQKENLLSLRSQKVSDTQTSKHLVPVQIVEQQPAGLLVFKGALDVPLNDAIGIINVAGTIRQTDIQPNGTFSATKVANLNITI